MNGDAKVEGLTKRELFAAMAMQGYCSDYEWRQDVEIIPTARCAVAMADALIAELSKRVKE